MRNFFKSIEGKAIKENPVPEGALKVFLGKVTFHYHKNGIFYQIKN